MNYLLCLLFVTLALVGYISSDTSLYTLSRPIHVWRNGKIVASMNGSITLSSKPKVSEIGVEFLKNESLSNELNKPSLTTKSLPRRKKRIHHLNHRKTEVQHNPGTRGPSKAIKRETNLLAEINQEKSNFYGIFDSFLEKTTTVLSNDGETVTPLIDKFVLAVSEPESADGGDVSGEQGSKSTTEACTSRKTADSPTSTSSTTQTTAKTADSPTWTSSSAKTTAKMTSESDTNANVEPTEAPRMIQKNITLADGHVPFVTIPPTTFIGKTMKLQSGNTVYAFLGIPYATPPVDELRFKPTVPLNGPSTGAFNVDATQMQPPCFPTRLQLSSTSAAGLFPSDTENNSSSVTTASEDCLYLNIWLPETVIPGSTSDDEVVKTLIWLHGEGFLSGRGDEDANTIAEFVAATEIAVVAVQYRLGVFGFLYLESTSANGNMGLQDQMVALQWIEDYIEFFGGDTQELSIMGHDTGAVFVGFHLLSYLSPGYFKTAIMIGGSPLQPNMYHSKSFAKSKAATFSGLLNCSQRSMNATWECLIALDSRQIWDAQCHMHDNLRNTVQFPFVPTENHDVLHGSPSDLMEKGFGKTTAILIGSSANPGSLILRDSIRGIQPHGASFISYDKFRTILFHILDEFRTDVWINTVIHQYTNWNNLTNGYENQLRLADALGDFYFTCPQRRFSDFWSSRGLSTYHFTFSHQSSIQNRPKWMGAVHGDELDFFFGVPALRLPDKFTSEEVEFSKETVTLLENFIKTGIPHSEWKTYGRDMPFYADFDLRLDSQAVKSGLREQYCAFWNDVFPQLIQALEYRCRDTCDSIMQTPRVIPTKNRIPLYAAQRMER